MKDFFKDKKFNSDKLSEYGFVDNVYKTDIMDGEFSLTVKILENKITTELREKDTGELYTLHLVDDTNGVFIGQIKEEYEKVLNDISEKCSDYCVFKFKYTNLIIEYVKNKYGDDVEYLWKKFPENAVCRKQNNKKWYLALLTVTGDKLGLNTCENIEIIDLRESPDDIAKLVDNKKYFAGYHMNKKHWYTIILDGSVPIEEIYERIERSYNLK